MEWTVVTVVVALAGLFAAVAKPIVSLTRSITELTVVVKNLQGDVKGLTEKNSQGHARLWEKSEEQDRRLDDHEQRLHAMEHQR